MGLNCTRTGPTSEGTASKYNAPAEDLQLQQPRESGLGRKWRGGRSNGQPAGAGVGSKCAGRASVEGISIEE